MYAAYKRPSWPRNAICPGHCVPGLCAHEAVGVRVFFYALCQSKAAASLKPQRSAEL